MLFKKKLQKTSKNFHRLFTTCLAQVDFFFGVGTFFAEGRETISFEELTLQSPSHPRIDLVPRDGGGTGTSGPPR